MRYYSKRFKIKITKLTSTSLAKEDGFNNFLAMTKAINKHKKTSILIKKFGQTIDWNNVDISKSDRYLRLPLMTVIKSKPLNLTVSCYSMKQLAHFEEAFLTTTPIDVKNAIEEHFRLTNNMIS